MKMDENNEEPQLAQTSAGAEAARPYVEKIGDGWSASKTMPSMPHEYIVRMRYALSWDEFSEFATLILSVGFKKRFGPFGRTRPSLTYMNLDGFRYWNAGAKDDVLETHDVIAIVRATTIINRCPVETPWRPLTAIEQRGQQRLDV
jgi:hypothetical protein